MLVFVGTLDVGRNGLANLVAALFGLDFADPILEIISYTPLMCRMYLKRT
jgi:hypothetical protein